MNGDGSDFTTVNGIIADIEVDQDSNRLYFLTRAEDVEEAGTEDSIWRVANASTAINATPVKVTIVGSVGLPVTQANFYPTDMIMDEVNDILYVESENSNLPRRRYHRRYLSLPTRRCRDPRYSDQHDRYALRREGM